MSDTRTTAELMARDAEIGNELDRVWPVYNKRAGKLWINDDELTDDQLRADLAESERESRKLLAERRAIRAELERRREDQDQPEPDSCCECDQVAVGVDDQGSPFCAEHYRRRPAFFDHS